MVIWIIGKSGSGKSYLGKFLENKLKNKFNHEFLKKAEKILDKINAKL